MNEGENSDVPQSPVFSSGDLVSVDQTQGEPENNLMVGAIISTGETAPLGAAPDVTANHSAINSRQRFTPSQNKMARAALALSGTSSNEVTRDNRKKFAIIGAIALAFVVLVIVCIVGFSGNNQKKTARSEMINAWNIFGNYLLTGSEKEAKITYDFRQSANIAIRRAPEAGGEEAGKRNSKIEELYENAVKKSGDEQQELKESARIVMALQKIPSIPDNTWMMYYMVNGDTRDSMRDRIYERYALINDQGTPKVVKELLLSIIDVSENRINLAEKYVQNGCVDKRNVVKSDCKKTVDSWYSTYIADINRKIMNIETIKRGLYSDLFKEIAELGNE